MSDTQRETISDRNRISRAAGETVGGTFPDEGSMVSALTWKSQKTRTGKSIDERGKA